MIEKITVRNFRCFSKLEINNLARLNVLVGRNGSGKTALLESIFIGNGNPELLLRIRAQRLGDNTALLSSDSLSILPLFQPMFHAFDMEFPITITAFGPGINTIAKLSKTDSGLKYEFQPRGLGKTKVSNVKVGSEGEIKISPPPVIKHKIAFFASSLKHSVTEASRQFSELSKRNETAQFISALRTALPTLEDLSIEIETGIPMIFAKMSGLSERIPMQFVSDGIYRLLTILIGISNKGGGAVLIDELENGIYHQTFPQILQLIYNFAVTYNVQVFLTTHSKELLQALARTAQNNEQNYSLLRFDGGSVEQFGGVSFRSAVEQDIEIR